MLGEVKAISFSVVIPVFNGAETIGPLVRRLLEVFDSQDLQIVLVDDGSGDQSDSVCRSLHRRHRGQVVYIHLSRNFGEHNAVMAGLHRATGDYVVIMDDDFQNPPAEVRRLIDHTRVNDHDVVYTRYLRKHHPWYRNLGSRFNDSVATLLIGKPKTLYLSSFKCLNRFLVREVLKYSGPYPYIDGLILRCTRNIGSIEVRHDPRTVGRSNYSLRKLVRLWLNMFVNFSVLPLRVSAVIGLACSALGVLWGLIVLVERIRRPDTPVGWASILITLITFSGAQLVMLGVLGEYVGRLFLSGNQTPQFVVREAFEGTDRPCATPPNSTTSAANEHSSPADWGSSAATSPSAWSLSEPK